MGQPLSKIFSSKLYLVLPLGPYAFAVSAVLNRLEKSLAKEFFFSPTPVGSVNIDFVPLYSNGGAKKCKEKSRSTNSFLFSTIFFFPLFSAPRLFHTTY